jgi:hypothetical protein
MDEIIHDLLLFLSVAVTPVIFGFLLYLGLTLSHDEDVPPAKRAKDQRHPFKLEP